MGGTGSIDSSASSVSGFNVGVVEGEGILLKETETDMEPEIGSGEDGEGIGHVEVPEDRARKNLRDHLRKTLNQRSRSGDGSGRGEFVFVDTR